MKDKNIIPWKLTVEFDKEKHLFSGSIDTDYMISSYSCSCGHEECIVTCNRYNLDEYICPACNNEIFYDANKAWKCIEYFLKDNDKLKLDYKYEIFTYKNRIESLYITYIPASIDFLKNKINFKAKIINSLTLYYSGEIEDNRDNLDKLNIGIYGKIENMLNAHLAKNINHLNIPIPPSEKITYKKVSFFFKHRNLKDFEFYRWKNIELLTYDKYLTTDKVLKTITDSRKEKSFKKAVYKNYQKQVKSGSRISMVAIEEFSLKIKDPNMIVKFLRLDLHRFEYGVKSILDFLLLKYSEKQIYIFFGSLNNNNENSYLYNDILRELMLIDGDKSQFFNECKKPKCDLRSLHDSLVDYNSKKREEKIVGMKLSLRKEDLKLCGMIDNYKVILPENGSSLYSWSKILHNCMASYYARIAKNETLIYCFFKKENIEFAVEIQNDNIIQATAIYNRQLNTEQYDILEKWYKIFFPQKKFEILYSIPIEVVYD